MQFGIGVGGRGVNPNYSNEVFKPPSDRAHGYAGDRCAADLALRHDLGFEFWVVVTPLGALGDRLVRHGVHDFHRAHDARSVRLSQDGIAGRIQKSNIHR